MELMTRTVRVPGSRIESRLRAAPHYNGAVARIGQTRWMADETRICTVRTYLTQGDAQENPTPEKRAGKAGQGRKRRSGEEETVRREPKAGNQHTIGDALMGCRRERRWSGSSWDGLGVEAEAH